MPNAKYIGSTFDDFLAQEGLEAAVTASAIKRVLAWQTAQDMEKETLTKTDNIAL